MDASCVQEVSQKQGNWINIKDAQAIIASNPSYKNIVFSDGKIKLMDYLSSMKNSIALRKFLENTTDINTSLPNYSPLWPGSTFLHLAVLYSENLKNEGNSGQLINQLLDKGASVLAQDLCGATPIHLAFRLNQQHIIALLIRILEARTLQVSNLLDNENLSLLHIACTAEDHRHSLARKLLSDQQTIGPTINVAYKGKALTHVKENWTPLHVAVNQSRLSLIELLLHRGASIKTKDAQGHTVIHWLFGSSTMKVVADVLFAAEQLEDFVAEHNGLTHLHVAIWFNDTKAVKRLLDLGANIEATIGNVESKYLEKFSNCTPLSMAMKLDYHEIVEILIHGGSDILAQKPDGKSSLSEAMYGKVEDPITKVFVKFILSNVELQKVLKEKLGLTMLHLACYISELDRVEELLATGADVNAKLHDQSNFWSGYSPLHVLVVSKDWSFDENDENIFKKLLESGCDIDQQDDRGLTALHLACTVDGLNVIRKLMSLLLSAGADINIEDDNGEAVLSWALELRSHCWSGKDLREFWSIIRALIEHMSKMKVLKLEVSALNKNLIETTREKYDFVVPSKWDDISFCNEVEATEQIKIGERGLSLHSFLCETGTISKFPSLTPEDRNEVAAFVQSYNDKNFLSLLNFQYRKAVARLSLIDPSRDALKILICSSFPDLCVDIILRYLSNSQLKQLITAASIENNAQ